MDAVLFDLDDTLCRYRVPGRELLDRAFEAVGVEPLFAVEDYHAVYDDYAESADTVEGLREACFADLATQAGVAPDVGRAVARAYAAERDHRNVEPLDGALEAVRTLADDHRLGLVTNGAPSMQGQKLDAIGLTDAFETVVHGGHDAPAKPAPEPFHAALDVLDVSPDRTVHVGNNLETDVAGANAAGVRAVWLRSGEGVGDAVPDYTVDTPAELTDPPWR